MITTVMLPLDSIRTDGGTQPRSVLNFETVDDYAEAMKAGAKFPPVTVYYDGETHWLGDGFHRHRAAWQAELLEIEAEIIQGTLDDAKWHSFGANQQHGLRRTNEDKQRAVQAALLHPKSSGLSDSAIAKHIGVDSQTVSNWRHKLESSSEVRKIDPAPVRTVTRNGTTYQQNTSNIGRSSAVKVMSEPKKPEPAFYSAPARRQVKLTTSAFKSELLKLARAYDRRNSGDVAGVVFVRTNGDITDVHVINSEDLADWVAAAE